MENKVIKEFPLSTGSDYFKVYGEIFTRNRFTGLRVTRTWLDKKTNEQTDPVFTFSASLKEVKELRRNFDVAVKELEDALDNGMQRRQQIFTLYFVEELDHNLSSPLHTGSDGRGGGRAAGPAPRLAGKRKNDERASVPDGGAKRGRPVGSKNKPEAKQRERANEGGDGEDGDAVDEGVVDGDA